MLLLITVIIAGCSKKEESTPANSSPLKVSLSSDYSTIYLGGETPVTATVGGASGTVTYSWSVNTSSTIIGDGYKVRLYASCPSCTGPNEVTCTAKDASGNKGSAKITVTVQ